VNDADKIQELSIKQTEMSGQLENIRLQMLRIAADQESEKGTVSRANARLHTEYDKLHDLLYNQDTGVMFQLDRLKQKELRRDADRKWIAGIAAAVILLILKDIISYIQTIK